MNNVHRSNSSGLRTTSPVSEMSYSIAILSFTTSSNDGGETDCSYESIMRSASIGSTDSYVFVSQEDEEFKTADVPHHATKIAELEIMMWDLAKQLTTQITGIREAETFRYEFESTWAQLKNDFADARTEIVETRSAKSGTVQRFSASSQIFLGLMDQLRRTGYGCSAIQLAIGVIDEVMALFAELD